MNHTWLEDCFIYWKYISPAHEKYISFPPGLNFSEVLGDRALSRTILHEGLKDVEVDMEEERQEREKEREGVDVEMNDVYADGDWDNGGQPAGGQNGFELGAEIEEPQMPLEEDLPLPRKDEKVARPALSARAKGKRPAGQEEVIEVSDVLYLFNILLS